MGEQQAQAKPRLCICHLGDLGKSLPWVELGSLCCETEMMTAVRPTGLLGGHLTVKVWKAHGRYLVSTEQMEGVLLTLS